MVLMFSPLVFFNLKLCHEDEGILIGVIKYSFVHQKQFIPLLGVFVTASLCSLNNTSTCCLFFFYYALKNVQFLG